MSISTKCQKEKLDRVNDVGEKELCLFEQRPASPRSEVPIRSNTSEKPSLAVAKARIRLSAYPSCVIVMPCHLTKLSLAFRGDGLAYASLFLLTRTTANRCPFMEYSPVARFDYVCESLSAHTQQRSRVSYSSVHFGKCPAN